MIYWIIYFLIGFMGAMYYRREFTLREFIGFTLLGTPVLILSAIALGIDKLRNENNTKDRLGH